MGYIQCLEYSVLRIFMHVASLYFLRVSKADVNPISDEEEQGRGSEKRIKYVNYVRTRTSVYHCFFMALLNALYGIVLYRICFCNNIEVVLL